MHHVATVKGLRRLRDETPDPADRAEEFHEASKFHRATFGRMVHHQRLSVDPDVAAGARLGARTLSHLPQRPLDRDDFEAASRDPRFASLVRAPSCRTFTGEALPPQVLSRLLGLSYGAYPQKAATGRRRRPLPSGGALYPLEIYVVGDVDGSGNKGAYHYNVLDHALEEVQRGLPAEAVRGLGIQQDLLENAALIVIITAVFNRSRFKYGPRGYRFCLMEAGSLIQQLQLVAQALGLGSVAFAGLLDDAVEDLLRIDGVDESFVNAVLVGRTSVDAKLGEGASGAQTT
ncbi:SagB-type dehydrogenase family enzyme [Kribbella sp. VKM Ac-2571]|nr:SagB-type dehydrogenase family enzyme [Kribbella sp. VKM Ac-2571]